MAELILSWAFIFIFASSYHNNKPYWFDMLSDKLKRSLLYVEKLWIIIKERRYINERVSLYYYKLCRQPCTCSITYVIFEKTIYLYILLNRRRRFCYYYGTRRETNSNIFQWSTVWRNINGYLLFSFDQSTKS